MSYSLQRPGSLKYREMARESAVHCSRMQRFTCASAMAGDVTHILSYP